MGGRLHKWACRWVLRVSVSIGSSRDSFADTQYILDQRAHSAAIDIGDISLLLLCHSTAMVQRVYSEVFVKHCWSSGRCSTGSLWKRARLLLDIWGSSAALRPKGMNNVADATAAQSSRIFRYSPTIRCCCQDLPLFCLSPKIGCRKLSLILDSKHCSPSLSLSEPFNALCKP
jgi:hypothetical protein